MKFFGQSAIAQSTAGKLAILAAQSALSFSRFYLSEGDTAGQAGRGTLLLSARGLAASPIPSPGHFPSFRVPPLLLSLPFASFGFEQRKSLGLALLQTSQATITSLHFLLILLSREWRVYRW